MKYKKINEEVFYPTDSIIEVSRDDMDDLEKKSRDNKRQRARICTHSSTKHLLHEMLIVHHQGVYVRPHNHINKIESFHIINGEVDIVIFNREGRITNVLEMGEYSTGKSFYCRLPEECYHTLLVNSPRLMIHEITNGPFLPEQTFFATWAPDENNTAEVKSFIANLKKEANTFILKKKPAIL